LGRGVQLYRPHDEPAEGRDHTQLWHVQLRAEEDRHRQQQVHTGPAARVRHSREVRSDARHLVHQVPGERAHTRASAQLHCDRGRDAVLARRRRIGRAPHLPGVQPKPPGPQEHRVHVQQHRQATNPQQQSQDEVLQGLCQLVRCLRQSRHRNAKRNQKCLI
jgi:hypothetical protein